MPRPVARSALGVSCSDPSFSRDRPEKGLTKVAPTGLGYPAPWPGEPGPSTCPRVALESVYSRPPAGTLHLRRQKCLGHHAGTTGSRT